MHSHRELQVLCQKWRIQSCNSSCCSHSGQSHGAEMFFQASLSNSPWPGRETQQKADFDDNTKQKNIANSKVEKTLPVQSTSLMTPVKRLSKAFFLAEFWFDLDLRVKNIYLFHNWVMCTKTNRNVASNLYSRISHGCLRLPHFKLTSLLTGLASSQ